MPPFRCDLGERREHESPLAHARVREDRIPGAPPRADEVEDVDVDLARTVSEAGSTAHSSLDRLRCAQQISRGTGPLDRGDRVQEVRLRCEADGLGPIVGRDRTQAAQPRGLGERALDARAGSAEVRSEREIGEARRVGVARR
jgi:hypothetical protein